MKENLFMGYSHPTQIFHAIPSFLAHANCTLFCALNAQKRTASQQGKKTFFLGCLMNVIFGVVKKIASTVLRNSVFLNMTFLIFLWPSECARPCALMIFKVEFVSKHKNP